MPKQEAVLRWWVQQCRQRYNNSKMTDDRHERLEAIRFVSDGAKARHVRDSFRGKPVGTWHDKLNLILEFKAMIKRATRAWFRNTLSWSHVRGSETLSTNSS